MSEAQRTVRVFISSPGDVVEERDQARRVIQGLQRQYSGVTLQPVLWEELALPATASFQETIDVLLERQPIDVAVFILWSRLGSPLGAAVTRPDGSPYLSGTEREFDMMLAAFEQSGRQRPIILAYARDDDVGFKQKLTESPSSALEELIAQRKLTEAFIREQFYDDEGHNSRALQSYHEPVGFAQRLRVHLRQALDNLLVGDAAPHWLDDPYRGLKVFDTEHAAIFHGRDEETCDLLQRLRDQRRAGCSFVVIVGASGSGKSSLARAGVAASLLEYAGDDDVNEWRVGMLIPSLREMRQDESEDKCGDLCSLLTGTLAEVLPDLGNSATMFDDIATGLAQDPALTVRLSIAPVFSRTAPMTAANEEGSDKSSHSQTLRVLLVLDQMEELWTDRRITAEDRERFLLAVEALARSGHVAVLATLRSDFYPHAQQIETFLRLKGERGHFDLLPPGPAALGRLITEPARLAGARFEQDEHTGRSLNEVILQDAAHDPAALPLLQYTLDELWRHRDEGNRQLTFASYEELGGVEGSLGKRAEEVFDTLAPDAQATLSDILPLLVTVDTAGDPSAVRRRASLDELTVIPVRAALTNALIGARFLTTDRQDESPTASLAHEALLRRWDRIADWITANRDHLRVRARLEHNQKRWEQQRRDNSLLLPTGLPIEEARQLLTDAPHLLTDTTTEYVRTSIGHQEAVAQRTQRRRRIVTTVLSILTLVASLGGIFAWKQQQEANQQRSIAVSKASEAAAQREKANAHLTRAEAARTAAEDHERNAIAEKERAEQQLYLSKLYRGARDIESHRHHQAAAVIATIPFPARQWEARYLARQAAGTPLTLHGHEGPIDCLAYSPDGRRIASCGEDRTIRVWDANTGEEILTLQGHEQYIASIAYSPDGESIVSGAGDNMVKVWDVKTGAEKISFAGHQSSITAVAFSPDGLRIASASTDKTVKAWDADSGNNLITFTHPGTAFCLAFSPDGQTIVTGSFPDVGTKGVMKRPLRVWEVETGRELLSFGHERVVRCVAFSPDGQRIASGYDSVRLWDAATGTELLNIKNGPGVRSVAFSPDGRHIVASTAPRATTMVGDLKIWNSSTGAQVLALPGHQGRVNAVEFSPDGRRIVSGSEDLTVKVWNVEEATKQLTLREDQGAIRAMALTLDGRLLVSSSGSNEIIRVWDTDRAVPGITLQKDEQFDPFEDVEVSPDGRWIASCESYFLDIWNAETGIIKLSLRQPDWVQCLAFSPSGEHIVAGSGYGDGIVRVFDSKSGKETVNFQAHNRTASILSIAFAPHGRWIASCCDVNRVKVWDIRDGTEALTLQGNIVHLNSITFSPDGRRLAGGSGDGTVIVWDVESGSRVLVLRGHESYVASVAYSPDGKRIVSASADKTVRVWNAQSGTELLVLRGHDKAVTSVAFSRDGQKIYSGSDDGTVVIWDATVWKETFSLRGHRDLVTDVEFSPDRKQIVSGSMDATVKVWDTDTASESRTFRHERGVNSVAFSSDGRWVVSGSDDKTVRLWDTEAGREALVLRGHEHRIYRVGFSANGSQIVSSDGRGRVIVWDIGTGSRPKEILQPECWMEKSLAQTVNCGL